MKRLIFICTALAVALSACKSEEIPTYSGDSYIYFDKPSDRSTSVSFAVMPGEDEYELRIPVTVVGKMPSADKAFAVRVVTTGDNSTTLSSASYELPDAPIIHAGLYKDYLSVILRRTTEIDGLEKKLVIAIDNNENYKVGMTAHSTATIFVGDLLIRPDWWTTQVSTIFLGPYSEEKYMAFITATGEWDMSEVNADDFVSYVRTFIYYLRRMDDEHTTVYESDGTTKVLDSITYTNA